MQNRSGMRVAVACWIGMASAWLIGCCGDEPPTAACPAENTVGGVCAGVPAGDACTDGVTCASVVSAKSDAELSSAAVAAMAGTCITLAPGQYAAVTLPGGVSLLGKSAEAVKIAGVTLEAGDGAVLCGLGVGASGVRVKGATGVRIESVRVTGERDQELDGIALDAGAAVTILASEIASSGRIGVFAQDADVTLERTVVSGAQGGGIRIQGSGCATSCVCTSQPALTVTNSVIRDNHVFGIAAEAASVSLEVVDVTGGRPGDAVSTGKFGAGISAARCSNILSAKRVRVLNNRDWGVLIDKSWGKLGEESSEEGEIEISDNLRGLWIQNITQSGCTLTMPCVSLHGGALEGNFGVGVGVAGESKGIILCRSKISLTAKWTMSVFDESGEVGLKPVGDGIDWLDESEVKIEQITLIGSARQSLLIDGPTGGNGGTVTGLNVEEDKTPLQQNYTAGAATPSGMSLTQEASRRFAIPQPLTAP